jgi:predicted DNA binding CopG/RHH family protein
MFFDWNDPNIAQIAEHGVLPSEAKEILLNDPLDLDHNLDDGEGVMALMERLLVPKFGSEAEEAKWWFENQDALDREFAQAAAEGRLGHGTVARRMGIPTTTIRLDPADIALAREQASKRGLKYQTYLKMLVHEALLKAEV